MTIVEKLQRIQVELKAPKNQYNSFGKYKYRSAEDILEAIKPYEEKYKVVFKITESLNEVAGRPFIKSEVKLIDLEEINTEHSIVSEAVAIIDFDAKGMQMPQRTGAASSYAKKYSLGNLLLLDDTKDSDATNTHGKEKPALKLGSPEYKRVKSALSAGKATIAQVRTKYTVSTEIEKSLNQ